MSNLFQNFLEDLNKKLEKQIEEMRSTLTEEDKAEFDAKQKETEKQIESVVNAIVGVFGDVTKDTEDEPKDFYKQPEEKAEKKNFQGFKDTVSPKETKQPEEKKFKGFEDAMIQNLGTRCKKEEKPVKDKPIQMVQFRDEDVHKSLASQVANDVRKQTVDFEDKLYKSLCKDIDCALLNKEYTISDNNSVVIKIVNKDIYRRLNSSIINSVVDHYITDEDFRSVDISMVNVREPGGESYLRITLVF